MKGVEVGVCKVGVDHFELSLYAKNGLTTTFIQLWDGRAKVNVVQVPPSHEVTKVKEL